MLKLSKKIVPLLLILSLFSFPEISFGKSIVSDFLDSLVQKKNEQQKQLQAVRAEKTQKEKKVTDLEAAIQNADLQIKSTIVAMQKADQDIAASDKSIKDSQSQIKEIEQEMQPLRESLKKILPIYHEISEKTPLGILLSADSISAATDEIQSYNQLSQNLASSVESLNNQTQKLNKVRDNLKAEKEYNQKLKEQKAIQKKGLEAEKTYKAQLVDQTKTDIANLEQQELDLSKKEQEVEEQINQFLAEYKASNSTQGQKVKKGDIIGYQGSTGFVTGSHLHLTTFIDGNLKKYQNPYTHLNEKHIIYPLDNFRVTQGFGCTPFAKCGNPRGPYGGGPHNGIDIANYLGAPVRAAADGTIIMNKYFGSYGNAIIIDHGNNLYTLYGHLAE